MVNYLKHMLDGCRERARRADEHLAELEREVAVMFEKQAHTVPFDLDPKPPHGATKYWQPPETFAGIRFETLVGEICYNLRCVLDYLVYALAELDSGSPQKGTQFPIMDLAKDFAGRGNAMLARRQCRSCRSNRAVATVNGMQMVGGSVISPMRTNTAISSPAAGIARITVHSGLEKDISRIWGVERKAPQSAHRRGREFQGLRHRRDIVC